MSLKNAIDSGLSWMSRVFCALFITIIFVSLQWRHFQLQFCMFTNVLLDDSLTTRDHRHSRRDAPASLYRLVVTHGSCGAVCTVHHEMAGLAGEVPAAAHHWSPPGPGWTQLPHYPSRNVSTALTVLNRNQLVGHVCVGNNCKMRCDHTDHMCLVITASVEWPVSCDHVCTHVNYVHYIIVLLQEGEIMIMISS